MPDTVDESSLLSSDRAADGRARGQGRSLPLALLVALRPKQWIKNGVILAPLLFSHSLTDLAQFLRAVIAFTLFCAVSSAVYLLNDILDLENDRRHPEKAHRPLAAGEISIPQAATAGLVLAVAGLALSYRFSSGVAAMAGIYLFINLLYSAWLKNVVIVDVMIISSGFVIRALTGALAIEVEISAWLVLCTVLLSLFLGFTKRRQEIAQLEGRAVEHRAILSEYSIGFLDQMISIVTSATLVAYFLYTLAPETRERLGTPYLPLTIPFVLYGIFRYLYLVHQRQLGGNPTSTLYGDRPLFANVILWAATAAVILYLT